MIRVGFFTGKIYDETIDRKNIQECCRILDLPDEVTDKLKKELKENCNGCIGGCGMNPL